MGIIIIQIAPENIPEFLGGKCKCLPDGCLIKEEGMWMDKLKLPSELDSEKALMPEPIEYTKY